jgi:predicted ATPase/DNA-binding SARP family transcriptional activator
MTSVMVNLGMFTLRLFGNPHIEVDGEVVASLGTRKAIALAAYLAVTGSGHSRDTLVALLWPELDQQRGRAALRSTLSALKKGLADTGLVVDGDHVTLSLADVACDVVQFQAHLAAAQRHRHREDFVCDACLAALKAAVALYRDDFMAGFSLSDSIAFDEWQFFQTEQLRGQLAQVLGRLAANCQDRAQWQEALAYGRRWLLLDPLQEAAHRALMQVYGQMGQLTAVQRQFQKCVELLRDELGVAPSAETVAVYEAARKGRTGDWGVETKAQSQSPVSSLQSLTPLVGRTAELAQIETRLADPACRLLTLVGSGGMGKTRLGWETAVRHQATFIPLAPVSDTGHLVAAMATALNFSFYGTEPPQTQLLDFLREKSLLLVLDNFEHLLAGATFLLAILQHAPAIKMLVTSRERLHVRGEWIVEIRGLAVEGRNETAVQFFIQTAQRIHPDFPAEAQLADVRRICQLVEGMPLAIELAAAWVRVLDCAEIAQEIEHNLDFLATNLRDLPERHRSLRAVFDHSWQLLSEAERAAFQRLSVFRGGFERGAATAVTNTQLPTLLALVDKSLLRREGDGRYHIPEALRQFAAEKRRAIESELKQEHAHYFAHFLQAREAALKGSGQQKEALAEIGVEIENVRQAWHWAVGQGMETAVVQAMESLFLYYEMRSLFQEGAEMFGEAGVVGVRSRSGRFLQRLGRYTGPSGWKTPRSHPAAPAPLPGSGGGRRARPEAEHAAEHDRCGAGADGHVEPLVDADECGQQQEPRAEGRGERGAEEGHRAREGEQDALQRPGAAGGRCSHGASAPACGRVSARSRCGAGGGRANEGCARPARRASRAGTGPASFGSRWRRAGRPGRA